MKADREELWALVRLAGPLFVASAGLQLMALVDTAVMGRVSDVALGGVALAHGLFFTPSVLGMGVMMGLDPLIAQALGAGDDMRARRLLTQSAWLALGTSVLLTPPLLFLPPVLTAAGVPDEVVEMARPYFQIRLLSLLPFLLFVGGRSYLQARGRTRPLIWATAAANVVNLAGNLLFVFGGRVLPEWAGPLRRFPAIGVPGSAIATLIATVGMAAWVWIALARRKDVVLTGPSWEAIVEATRVGLPIGLQLVAEVGIFSLAGVLVGRLGAAPLAGHQVALQLASFTFMGAYGLAGAGSVRVGLHVGARDLASVRRAGVLALALTGVWMGACALAILVFPGPLAGLITDQPDIVRAALPLLGIVAVFQLSDGFQAVGAGLLRGAGDTRFPFLANLAGHYVFGLPLALWLSFYAGIGVVGVWWGLAFGLTVVAAGILVRFFRIARRPIRPLHVEPGSSTGVG